jgi:superfamily II DNA or RNA helicase
MGTDARLVSGRHSNGAALMLDRFRKTLQQTETVFIPLEYELDLDDQGRHLVRIYARWEQGRQQIHNVAELWQYGFNETIETEEGQWVYLVSDEDQQIFFSLRSMNPLVWEDGTLVFDIEPPVLSFLRAKTQVRESEAAEQIQILADPLQPTLNIDYEPDQGLQIQSGFTLNGNPDLIPADEIHPTPSGRFVRAGNTFAPRDEISPQAAAILQNPHVVIQRHNIPEFIQRDLVMLKTEFNAVLTDLAQQIQVIDETFQPTVHVKKNDRGWLDFEVDYKAGGYSLPPGLLTEKGGDRFIQVDDTTWVQFDPETVNNVAAEMDGLAATQVDAGYRLPISEFANLEEFITDIGGKAELSKAYQEFLDQLTGFEADEHFAFSPKFEAHLDTVGLQLRPYQRAGIHWLHWLQRNFLHGILADDMGLGKTLQSVCALRLAYELTRAKQHSLVIAPKSVLQHWAREIRRGFPGMRVYLYHGANRQKNVLDSDLPYILITTYDVVARDVDDLARVPFFYLILDEATKIKNPDTQRTLAIKALNATHRLALSGTPVENRPAELWSLFDFLMRGHLGKYGTFVRVYESDILAGKAAASKRLGRRIKPFILRRKKETVAQDLPEKVAINEWCELTHEQKQLYGGLQDQVLDIRSALKRGEQVNYTANVLPVLMHLKMICNHPYLVTGQLEPIYGRSGKFDWITEKIDTILARGEKIVIFSHFLKMLDLFEHVIDEREVPYIRIDGGTENRQNLIDEFNEGEAQVALLSLMAAGYGITLTAANHVIHADRWWNPAVEDQATDRVHRIGQDKTVFVYNIMTTGTLEERIEQMLDEKRGMADQIVGEAVSGARKWTRDELVELLRALD